MTMERSAGRTGQVTETVPAVLRLFPSVGSWAEVETLAWFWMVELQAWLEGTVKVMPTVLL